MKSRHPGVEYFVAFFGLIFWTGFWFTQGGIIGYGFAALGAVAFYGLATDPSFLDW